jgi:hypothetical protein
LATQPERTRAFYPDRMPAAIAAMRRGEAKTCGLRPLDFGSSLAYS